MAVRFMLRFQRGDVLREGGFYNCVARHSGGISYIECDLSSPVLFSPSLGRIWDT